MSANARLIALSLFLGLMVASCGQKGPLRLPEDSPGNGGAALWAADLRAPGATGAETGTGSGPGSRPSILPAP